MANVTSAGWRPYPRPWKTIVNILCLLTFLAAALFLHDIQLGDRAAAGGDSVIGVMLFFLLAVAATMGRRARQAEDKVREAARHAEQQRRQKEQHAQDEKSHREFTLEVLGVGAIFDHLRHDALWQALQQGDAYTSVRNQDPKRYPWSAIQKLEASSRQSGDVFVHAVRETPVYWVAPLLQVAPGTDDASLFQLPAAMAQHRFAVAERQHAAPDRILEHAFALFDQYPELPYVVVFADNSLARRERGRGNKAVDPVGDGYHLPAIPDAVAVLVLGRRDRVAALRGHVWDDPNNDYLRVTTTRALQACQPADSAHEGCMPAAADWLATAALLARDPLRYDGIGPSNMKAWDNDSPRTWKPGPWLPVAWTRTQLELFDRLPVLALIHRPVHIAFTDAQGHAITRNDHRLQLVMDGWREALHALPETVRNAGPARVIAASGNNERQLLALHGMLHQYAAQGGPEIDTSDIASFTGMERRLGDAGVATLPLQMVLGALASHKAGGASAIIHMRADGTGATIVLARPAGEGLCAM
jgi:hypothetical protein